MPPDEDALTIPDSWLRELHPRRGGTPGPQPRGSRAEDAAAMLDAAAAAVEWLLSADEIDADLRDPARRYLAGEADAIGAAVVAAAALAEAELPGAYRAQPRRYRAFIDRWRVEDGVGFAACALVELSGLEAVGRDGRPGVRRHGHPNLGGVNPETARYVRRLLVAASEDEYTDAERRLAGHRTDRAARCLVTYLVPTRRDWLAECLAPGLDRPSVLRPLLLCSVDDPADLGDPPPNLAYYEYAPGVLATMLDGLGTGVLGLLLRNIDDQAGAYASEMLLDAIAVLPSDDAFRALLDRVGRNDPRIRNALRTMIERFPVRTLRLLADADGEPAAALLREHAALHPELAAASDLPETARATLAAFAAEAARTPPASSDSLPFPLSGLRWDEPVRPVVAGLQPPAHREIRWLDGEHAEWAAEGERVPVPSGRTWDTDPLGLLGTGREPGLLLHGPAELVRPLLADWDGPPHWADTDWVRALVARFGMEAYPVARRMAKGAHPGRAELLLPFLDAEVVAVIGGWLGGKRGADLAADWCDRHGLAVVPFAVPAALGKAKAPRRAAEAVLRRIADRHGPDAVADAAPGPAASAAIREVLAAHPARTGLVRRPSLPGWADPAVLPRVLLRGRERALPPDAMRTLVELLVLEDAAGARVIAQTCDPESLAEFGLTLFEEWRTAGTPEADAWGLTQLACTGDERVLPVLLPLIRTWPGQDRLLAAERGLDIVAGIGTEAALAAVHDMAVEWKGVLLRNAAERAFAREAARRGLTSGQLGDRLVPDVDLDAAGAVTVDYGRRRFTVRFDLDLRPVVTDEDGALRKSLPKPGKRDDAEVAPAAHAAFAELKKSVQAVASRQTLRLRDAMLTGRRWTPAEFRVHVLGHPVVRLLGRRLVWLAETDDGATAFLLAEDGTFADVADAAFVPPESARIGVAHPALLGADLAAWVETFADYELLQPFEQLGRPAVVLTDAERAAGALVRFADRAVPYDAVMRLLQGGWARNRGTERPEWMMRWTARDRCVLVELEPGADPEHLIVRGVRAAAADRGGPSRAVPVRFADLDPVAVSEALVDVTALTETPTST